MSTTSQPAPARKRGPLAIARQAASAWIADGGPRLGASIAFYTIFAIAPLMLILIGVAGVVFGQEAASGRIFEQIQGVVGADAARSIQDLIAASHRPGGQGILAAAVGAATALLGASAVFIELKNAFDTIFRPGTATASAVPAFARTRLLSAALVLAMAFLVIVSLVVSAAAAALGKWLSDTLPLLAPLMALLDVALSSAMLTVAFSGLIRYLPDRAPRPRAIWLGALASALLFALGKHLIALYLTRTAVASAYGAAGSFIVFIMWVYYSAQILLLGAEVSRSIDEPDATRQDDRMDAAAAGS